FEQPWGEIADRKPATENSLPVAERARQPALLKARIPGHAEMRRWIGPIPVVSVRALINGRVGDSAERTRIEKVGRIAGAARRPEQVLQRRAGVNVVGVENVALEIPTQPVIDRQRATRAPGILRVKAEGSLALADGDGLVFRKLSGLLVHVEGFSHV